MMNPALMPKFNTIDPVKALINIGSLLDIPTGYYVQGKHGEHILNGGLGQLTGVVAIANAFKSTLMHYMMLSALERMLVSVETSAHTYDTEMNVHETRLKILTQHFDILKDKDLLLDGIWSVSDKTIYYGNTWFSHLKEFLNNKKDHKKELLRETPFLDRDGKTPISMMIPTFGEVDSLTEFRTEHAAEIENKSDLGSSERNTIFMRQGGAKSALLSELPTVTMSAMHYLLVTAHIGKDIVIPTGPIPQAPVVQISGMKNGDKIKEVSSKFFFLMSNCWHITHVSQLLRKGTRFAEYPKDSADDEVIDNDLKLLSVRPLRSKSGLSGAPIEIIVSQTEGVLASLSEFHYIKSNDRFGLSGSLQHYSLDIYPDMKLSRPTVRKKIDEDPILRRALNITAEMCQLKQDRRHLDVLCTPKELYDDLKAKGYDWDVLLHTRGWWTLNNDKYEVPFLSTMDLLRMRAGLYHPYWMDKK